MQAGLLILAWLYLHAPLLRWFGRTFSHTSFRLNAFLLAGAVALLAWRVLRMPRPELSLKPRQNPAALGLAVGCAILGLLSRRFVDVQMLEAPLFLLGSWALLGLFVTPPAWRRALVPTLVFVSVLPFGAQADAYLGFMARVLSAKVAAQFLGALGVPSMSAETVLVFENGVAQIDAPCSGLRSLWMGSVVFVLALWVEGQRLGLRVLGAFALLLVLLLGANITRVALIVAVSVVLDQPGLADVVHVPLGLIGFLAATAAPLLLLRRSSSEATESSSPTPRPMLSPVAVYGLSALCVLGASLDTARPSVTRAPAGLALTLPNEWRAEPVPLTSAEDDLLARFAEGRVAKLRLRLADGSAGLLLVESRSWRSHHPPELCLAGAGHRLSSVSEREIWPGFRVRFARLDEGHSFHVSWFQAKDTTHADLVGRIVAQVFDPNTPFVMVSVVTHGFQGPEDPAFVHFITELRARVARRLQEEPST